MTTSEIEVIEETESERVVRWRAAELERAGYQEPDALRVALRVDVDLHQAVDLITLGCPPAVALRILL